MNQLDKRRTTGVGNFKLAQMGKIALALTTDNPLPLLTGVAVGMT